MSDRLLVSSPDSLVSGSSLLNHYGEFTVDTAVIPVAGLGTRMWPYAPGNPKFMAPVTVDDRFIPNINFTFDECRDIGNLIIIVSGEDDRDLLKRFTGPISKEMVESYKDANKLKELELEIARRDALTAKEINFEIQQKGRYGTAISLETARDRLVSDGIKRFVLTGGDDFVIRPDGMSVVSLLINAWERAGTDHAIVGRPVAPEPGPKSSYGILQVDANGHLIMIDERPPIERVPANALANISRYGVTGDSIWEHLARDLRTPRTPEQPEFYVTDVFNASIRDGGKTVKVDKMGEQDIYVDCGNPQKILQAGILLSARAEAAKAAQH